MIIVVVVVVDSVECKLPFVEELYGLPVVLESLDGPLWKKRRRG